MPFRRIDSPPSDTPADAGGTPAAIAPRARRRPGTEADATPVRQAPPTEGEAQTDDRDYEVGRGKPPVHTRFRKGKSGNPNGRPSGAKGLKRLVRENLLARIPVRMAGGVMRITRIEAVVHKQLEQAMKGDQRAAVQLMNLYAAAVPDEAERDGAGAASALTASEEQILSYLLGANEAGKEAATDER